MATYTETKATNDLIARRSEENRKRIEQVITLAANTKNDLASMQAEYGPFIEQLNIDAANNPGDQAWIAAKAEKDQMVNDFVALKNRVESIQTALSGL